MFLGAARGHQGVGDGDELVVGESVEPGTDHLLMDYRGRGRGEQHLGRPVVVGIGQSVAQRGQHPVGETLTLCQRQEPP